MREPGLIDLTNFVENEMTLANYTLFSREAVGETMRSLKNQYDISFTPMLKQGQEMVFSRLPQANVPFVKRTMTMKNVQLFWLKVLKTKARHWIKGSYVMDVYQRSQKNTMPRAV